MKKVMKSILAMVVCLSVVLTTFSITAFASTAINVSPVYIETADGVITASAVVSNIDGTDAADVKLILAQYVGDSFDSVNSESVSVVAGGENLVKVSADEVSGATVKCFLWEDDSLKPLTSVPDLNATPELRGITIDGVLLNGFSAETTSYTVTVPTGGTIPYSIKGIPTNSALSSKTVIADNVATVTVSNPVTDATKVYTVNIALAQPDYTHAVQSAIEETDFTTTSTSWFGDVKHSSSAVATTVVGGDGKLYTNLHSGTAAENANKDGSPAESNGLNATSQSSARYIKAINDADAIGADYFMFNGGNTISALWTTKNTDVAALADGATLLAFNLTRPARVTIYAGNVTDTSDVTTNAENLKNCGYISKGWTYENAGSTPFMVSARSNDGKVENYNHKFYLDCNAGEVVIPYYTNFGSNITQAPIITVAPVGGQKKVEIASDFVNHVAGMTFDEYVAYAGENVTAKADGCDGEILFNIGLKENFNVGEALDLTSTLRAVSEINPAFDLEGCSYITLDAYTISDGQASNYKPWVKEAFSGRVDTYSDEVGVGFTKVVPWASFKVNVDCDVIVATVGSVTSLEEQGYVRSSQCSYTEDNKVDEWYSAFESLRNETTESYRTFYIKSFEKGQTVNVYNSPGGATNHIYLVRPR